jgi:acylphosphatase
LAFDSQFRSLGIREWGENRATELQLKGDVRNEGDGSVVGFMQGTAAAVEAMKVWLRTKGSPKSRIDSAEFTQCSARGDVLAFRIIGKD